MNEFDADFQSFHKDRTQSNMKEVQKEYSLGKRIFDKYDIEDNYSYFNRLVLDNAQFTNCFIEACFSNCSFKNSQFLNCNLKTVRFIDCNLTNSIINECSIEAIDFTKSILEGLKFGVNYAYGTTLNSDSLSKIYLLNEVNKS